MMQKTKFTPGLYVYQGPCCELMHIKYFETAPPPYVGIISGPFKKQKEAEKEKLKEWKKYTDSML